MSAIFAFVMLMISILISELFFKKDAIAAFGSAFSNTGFFGVPLIIACVSSDASLLILYLNIWTPAQSATEKLPVAF